MYLTTLIKNMSVAIPYPTRIKITLDQLNQISEGRTTNSHLHHRMHHHWVAVAMTYSDIVTIRVTRAKDTFPIIGLMRMMWLNDFLVISITKKMSVMVYQINPLSINLRWVVLHLTIWLTLSSCRILLNWKLSGVDISNHFSCQYNDYSWVFFRTFTLHLMTTDIVVINIVLLQSLDKFWWSKGFKYFKIYFFPI